MSSRLDALRFQVAGWLGWVVVRTLMATVRVEVVGGREHPEAVAASGVPPILMCWHGHLLPLIHHHRHQGAVALASQHRDGEYITRVLSHLGFDAARGSSTRGGSRGLREMVKAARAGRPLAITPDGPRGPRHRVKGGALLAAGLTGHPILAMVAAADRGWVLGSWDGFLIPKPFSRVCIVYAPPFHVPREVDDEGLEALALKLEGEMERIGRLAEEAARSPGERGGRPPPPLDGGDPG